MHKNSIHIGQFITQYPYPDQFTGSKDYYCSGGERVAQEISQGLVDQGCKVSVFASAAGGEYEWNIQSGVSVHRSPSITQIGTTQIAPTLLIDALPVDLDIVHAHNTTPPGILSGWIHAIIHKVPLVITHHGGEKYEPHGSLFRRLGLDIYTKIMMKPIFEHATVAVTPSSGYIEESNVLRNNNTEVRTIPNGVNATQYEMDISPPDAKRKLGIDPSQFVILYMGAHHQRKGIEILLRAFDQFSENIPKDTATLILAGSGQLSDRLHAKGRKLGLESSIEFPGFVSEDDKPLYMIAADVFVLPSITPSSEVFPLVLLEAAAGGTPAIVSDFPALRSIVTQNNLGLIVEPGNTTALAGALSKMYKDDELRARLTHTAKQAVKTHNWRRISEQYRRLFEDITGMNNASHQ